MAKLLDEVEAALPCRQAQLELDQWGALDGAPLPASYREAVRWASNRLYLRTGRYQQQAWRSEVGVLVPELQEFVAEFRKLMANIGVPTHADICSRKGEHMEYVLGRIDRPGPECPYMEGRAVSLVHSIRGRNMPALAWDIFAHSGREVAAKLGIDVQWGGRARPWLWRMP